MDIDEIDKGLLVANRQTAADAEVLAARGVTHVLSLVPLASHVAERLAASVRISVQPMLDDNQEMLLLRLNALFAFLDEAAAMPGAVTLVHCHAGSSRSGAVVIAFLMRTRRMSFADALRFFCKQLELYETLGAPRVLPERDAEPLLAELAAGRGPYAVDGYLHCYDEATLVAHGHAAGCAAAQ